MYTFKDREDLLDRIAAFMLNNPHFEGLLQIGSGAEGYADIYSDIDLMAGCFGISDVTLASQQLHQFFEGLGTCHIEKRAWTKTALGLSVYFKNGLSADISFMPTNELPIRSPQFKVLFSKTEQFGQAVDYAVKQYADTVEQRNLNNSIHYRFVNEMRYVEIAVLRKQFVFAEMALGNARQILLTIEAANEGKKLHQFKAYNSLEKDFLTKLAATYPASMTAVAICEAKGNLLCLYLDVVRKSKHLEFDTNLLGLLGMFE